MGRSKKEEYGDGAESLLNQMNQEKNKDRTSKTKPPEPEPQKEEKVKKNKRISLLMTEEDFKKIDDAAYHARMSKNDFIVKTLLRVIEEQSKENSK